MNRKNIRYHVNKKGLLYMIIFVHNKVKRVFAIAYTVSILNLPFYIVKLNSVKHYVIERKQLVR